MTAIRAITLHQPFPQLVVKGHKRVETRHWRTTKRGPIAIHAAVRRVLPSELGPWYEAGEHCDGVLGQGGEHEWRSDGGHSVRWQWGTFPLGAVVATANLVDCVPIVRASKHVRAAGRFVQDYPGFSPGTSALWLCERRSDGTFDTHDRVEDQRPYGNFTPGRYAWLLDDITPVDPPIPAKGSQQFWIWEDPR